MFRTSRCLRLGPPFSTLQFPSRPRLGAAGGKDGIGGTSREYEGQYSLDVMTKCSFKVPVILWMGTKPSECFSPLFLWTVQIFQVGSYSILASFERQVSLRSTYIHVYIYIYFYIQQLFLNLGGALNLPQKPAGASFMSCRGTTYFHHWLTCLSMFSLYNHNTDDTQSVLRETRFI